MISVIPRDGVKVRDPRLPAIHGQAFVYLTGPVSEDEATQAGQQMLRHVRRGELWPGDANTAALAGIPMPSAQPAPKGPVK